VRFHTDDALVTSRRLAERARRDFSTREANTVLELLSSLEQDEDRGLGSERVQASVLILAAGDSRRFLSALALAQEDWRDVLVASGLADDDWRQRLGAWLTYAMQPSTERRKGPFLDGPLHMATPRRARRPRTTSPPRRRGRAPLLAAARFPCR
jgi:hypothetical protein